MKKLLLSTAAVALGVAAMAGPAAAEVDLSVGGHFKGYMAYADQDNTAGLDNRDLDILRKTEIHFSGETTLDNGLTVGAHFEADADGNDSFNMDESYVYFSGSWGRVNFGEEDGAAYLLQVAAPSADSNVDGIRQYVNAVNYNLTALNGTNLETRIQGDGLDYDNRGTDDAEKITYLTPVMSGFQGGISYTPDVNVGSVTAQTLGGTTTNQLNGVSQDDVAGQYGDAVELAVRYEGQMDELGVTLGAGYTKIDQEADAGTEDEFNEFNVGADFDWGAFGLGVVYTENNNGQDTLDDNETIVVGVDYTTGPFKLGASWLNNDTNINGAASEVETDRYTGGVVYTYGPGMSFRGSLSYVEHDVQGGADVEGTSLLVGTQINF